MKFDATKVEEYLNEMLMPFSSNPVWDEVHEHLNSGKSLECMKDKDGYEVECSSVLHDAWWDYFIKLDIPAHKVLYLVRLQYDNEEDEACHDGYIQDAGINLVKDSWKEAFSKLCRRTHWCGDGAWFIWLVHSELDFQYSPLQTGKEVCEQYIKFLLNTEMQGYWYKKKDLRHLSILIELLNERMDSFKSALGRAKGENKQEAEAWLRTSIERSIKSYQEL